MTSIDLSSCSEQQRRAVMSDAPAICVVAGAGSGKTRVATLRIARLISEGVPPAAFLVLTFTRKAARELRQRLGALIPAAKVRKIWAGTFHAISNRILQKWGSRIGYRTADVGQGITVLTPDDAEALWDDVVTRYGWTGRKRDILEARSALAHNGTVPEDRDLMRMLSEYQSRLMEANAIDFDGLLLAVHKLFHEAPDVLHSYRQQFQHVFVDEYQDTDHVQYDLHEVMDPPNLFVVGDARQAIYGWRGADVEIIRTFAATRRIRCEIIDLTECYRCSRPILDAANRLIGHNPEGAVPLTPMRDDGAPVVCRRGAEQDVADLLADTLAFEDPETVAVIARSHRLLAEVEARCRALRLPVFRVGGESKDVESLPEWTGFHAALRLAFNPHDAISYLRCRNWIDVSEQMAERIENYRRTFSKSIGRALAHHNVDTYVSLSLLAASNEPVTEVVSAWFSAFWPISMPTVVEKIIPRMEELDASEMTCAEWLERVSVRDQHAEIEKRRPGCTTLLTAHAAKGLEWDNVIVVGFDQGLFPTSMAIRDKKDHEERRLAYVAFTRARKRLIVLSGDEPSQFIAEAGLARVAGPQMEVPF